MDCFSNPGNYITHNATWLAPALALPQWNAVFFIVMNYTWAFSESNMSAVKMVF